MRYLLLLSLLLTGCLNDGAKTAADDADEDRQALEFANCFCGGPRGGISYVEKTKLSYSTNTYDIVCKIRGSYYYTKSLKTTVLYGSKPDECDAEK